MAKDIETIIALTNALYNASTRTSQAASRKSELEAERNNVQKQSTDIWTVSSLSSYIAGEKMLSEKKNEILSLLDSKISEAESNLQSAQLAESNARYALNMALNGN